MVAHDACMRHRVLMVRQLEYHRNPVHYFHHFHLDEDEKVEHCGGPSHAWMDPRLDYTIVHCACHMHAIDRPVAIGRDEELCETTFRFVERCPYNPKMWHLESGTIC